MMCINKVSSTIERAACPLTFKDILNYSSYFFSVFHFPVILLYAVPLFLLEFCFFRRRLHSKASKMGEDDDDDDDDTVLLFLAFTGALYASVAAVLPARSNLFSHLHIGCFVFFTPPPNKPSADGSTYYISFDF